MRWSSGKTEGPTDPDMPDFDAMVDTEWIDSAGLTDQDLAYLERLFEEPRGDQIGCTRTRPSARPRPRRRWLACVQCGDARSRALTRGQTTRRRR